MSSKINTVPAWWVGFIALFAIAAVNSPARVEEDRPFGWASQPGKGVDNGTTGGQGGSIDTVASTGAANDILGKSGPAIVFLKGTDGGGISFGSNDKTLIGLEGAQVSGISIGGKSNIIIRNITVRQGKCGSYGACRGGGDGIAISGSHHIWLDHCDIADGQDENISVNHGCDFITFSWNRIHYTYEKEHAFSILVASSDGDGGDYRLTFAYNWWADNVLQRMPRSRYGLIHVVNNLYTSVGNDYCIGVGHETNALIENNAFLNVNTPVIIDPDAAGGLFKGNLYDTSSRDPNGKGTDFVPFQDFVRGSISDTSFGAGGFTPPYDMDVMPATAVEGVVRKYAGAVLWSVPAGLELPTSTARRERRAAIFHPAFSGSLGSRIHSQVSAAKALTLQGKTILLNPDPENRRLTPGAYLFLPSRQSSPPPLKRRLAAWIIANSGGRR